MVFYDLFCLFLLEILFRTDFFLFYYKITTLVVLENCHRSTATSLVQYVILILS